MQMVWPAPIRIQEFVAYLRVNIDVQIRRDVSLARHAHYRARAVKRYAGIDLRGGIIRPTFEAAVDILCTVRGWLRFFVWLNMKETCASVEGDSPMVINRRFVQHLYQIVL